MVIDLVHDDYRDPFYGIPDGQKGALGRWGDIGTIAGKKGRLGITLPPNGFRRDSEACGIAGLINVNGKREGGKRVIDMLTTMPDRENGLGAGYACYGLFPELADHYCVQLLLDDEDAKDRVEEYFKSVANIVKDEKVFTTPIAGMRTPYPLIWRFFIEIPEKALSERPGIPSLDECMVDAVMHINEKIDGAFCMSSGKNMAVFKGNGWSDDVAKFYDLNDRYKGYMWLSHSRFPTNTPGWWGGAHPFNILDWGLCHNGEITSYGTNKRYVEMAGYKCTLLTDSEVVTYLWDLLCRRHGLPKQIASLVFSPPYYDFIDRQPADKKKLLLDLRAVYGRAMINGPFSILVGTNRPVPTFIALTDRKKLRPMIGAVSPDGDTVFASSEECAIRQVASPDDIWAPVAGNPIIASVGGGLISRGTEEYLDGRKIVLEGSR